MIITSFILFAVSVNAEAVDTAIALAKEKNLADSLYWHTLLHYKTDMFGVMRSLVDDPRFFLAADGKNNPESELDATIRAIMSPTGEPDMHPQCIFPARTAWLKEELSPLLDDLPSLECPVFEKVSAEISPQKVSLVFPYYNLTGPGSMFGHTMLRLKPLKSLSRDGYAVSYNANVTGASAFSYIFKGISGGFNGEYHITPYYSKFRDYANVEMRDVWEYELNLTPEEVWRMYLHIWEIGGMATDYYFFDENCAYNLLFFLEAAREGNKLTDGYTWVLPVDTVRAVAAHNMIAKVNFRPSNAKRMEVMADFLLKDGTGLAKEIALGEISPENIKSSELSEEKQAAALDLAYELIRYNYKYSATRNLSESKQRTTDILKMRSEYPFTNDYHIEQPANPELGHESARLMLGMGYGDNSPFMRVQLRAAHNSLIDNALGYMDGSSVSVGDIGLKYYSETGRFSLERLTFIDMLSLHDVRKLFGGTSWRFAMGMDDRSIQADRTLMTGYTNGGVGVGFSPLNKLHVWGLIVGEIEAATRYSSAFSLGYGVNGGAIYPTGSWGKLVLEGTYKRYSDSGKHQEGDLNVQYALYPSINHAIFAQARWLQYSTSFKDEFSLNYMYYF